MERIEGKENFVCSFADVTKESDRLTRWLYTRTLYSGTICREIATAALETLAATIRIAQTIASKVFTSSGVQEEKMDITTSDAVSANSGKSSVATLIYNVLLKTRYLKNDVQIVERAAQLMEEIGLLDNSLRVATGELKQGFLYSDDLNAQRQRIESMLSITMGYDAEKHGARARFDDVVTAEVERWLKTGVLEVSSLVSAVVTTFKKK